MTTILAVLHVLWLVACWLFLASVIAAPVVVVVRKARARGKRLFVDEPNAKVRALRPNTTHLHEMDAL
jgi:uncharacterized membrane protein